MIRAYIMEEPASQLRCIGCYFMFKPGALVIVKSEKERGKTWCAKCAANNVHAQYIYVGLTVPPFARLYAVEYERAHQERTRALTCRAEESSNGS